MNWGQAETERRVANMIRVATITSVDPAAGRARVTFGGDTESAWLPFPAVRAGAVQVWAAPSVGEQVVVTCPGGDTAQGLIVASLPSSGAPAPSGEGGAFVIAVGDSRIEISAAGVVVTAGGVSLALTGDGLAVTGGTVAHDGTDIGKTHVHSGVTAGGANTQPPV